MRLKVVYSTFLLAYVFRRGYLTGRKLPYARDGRSRRMSDFPRGLKLYEGVVSGGIGS